jgi:hypothetical protein
MTVVMSILLPDAALFLGGHKNGNGNGRARRSNMIGGSARSSAIPAGGKRLAYAAAKRRSRTNPKRSEQR